MPIKKVYWTSIDSIRQLLDIYPFFGFVTSIAFLGDSNMCSTLATFNSQGYQSATNEQDNIIISNINGYDVKRANMKTINGMEWLDDMVNLSSLQLFI